MIWLSSICFLPGHGDSLQNRLSSLVPLHSAPPFAASSIMILLRCWTPPPHGSEQWPHMVHCPHLQSTKSWAYNQMNVSNIYGINVKWEASSAIQDTKHDDNITWACWGIAYFPTSLRRRRTFIAAIWRRIAFSCSTSPTLTAAYYRTGRPCSPTSPCPVSSIGPC